VSDPQGIVSWWELDEASASLPAIAFGPSPNHGAYSGGLTFGGRAGGLGFNGTTGVVTVPDDGSLDTASGQPWAVWAQVKRGATGAVRTIISKGDKAPCLQLDATGKPQIRDNGVILCTAASAIDTNTHTILAGRSGTTATIYVDGVQVATTAAAASTTTPNALPLRIGADTSAGGTAQAFFNGTIFAAAFFNADTITSSSVGPIVLPALGRGLPSGQYGIGIPALLTTYRDPADTTNLSGSIEVLVGHGRSALAGPYGWNSNTSIPGGASGSFTPDASGHATIAIPFLNSWNGKTFDLSITAGSTTWLVGAIPQWALARLANVALGDNVSGLGATTALMPFPANHVAGLLLRAANGPANSSYAPGSAWSTNPASIGTLPAKGAYLAAQLQVVRTA
jgi:hypothetical protein